MKNPIDSARLLLDAVQEVVDGAVTTLGSVAIHDGRVDRSRVEADQVFAYDLAHGASLALAGASMLEWADDGDELKGRLCLAFAGHVANELTSSVIANWSAWDVDVLPWLRAGGSAVADAHAASQDQALFDAIATHPKILGAADFALDPELDLIRDAVRDFARRKLAPLAERIHSFDEDIPDEVLASFSEMGLFALAIPKEHGGLAAGGAHGHSEEDFQAMLVTTEEVCRVSMGLAGPFVTRPEILATVLLRGGTPEQANRMLPRVASGDALVAVAVTEPDFGSDVANLTTTATREGDSYRLNGVKTWSTFAGKADVLLVLARTGERDEGFRGLSLFMVEKPRFAGHEWTIESELGGRLEGRAIRTIGYRGMHSFEISFEDFVVGEEALIGGVDGLGKGFYLQMNAFSSGRVQTAARAVGLMLGATEEALRYATDRHVFGSPLIDYGITRRKIATSMALAIATKTFSYHCAGLLSRGEGQLEASMVKLMSCRVAEWVTRESQQIHGGYGYAEEYPVARFFLDARVLSLFEGADETLALRVIAPGLLQRHVKAA